MHGRAALTIRDARRPSCRVDGVTRDGVIRARTPVLDPRVTRACRPYSWNGTNDTSVDADLLIGAVIRDQSILMR